jgi:hypothetical protein
MHSIKPDQVSILKFRLDRFDLNTKILNYSSFLGVKVY